MQAQPHEVSSDRVAPLAAGGLWAGYAKGPDVLQGVDLEVCEGELCAVIGPNGSGKSTLLRVLAGLLEPRRGWVRLCGEAVSSLDRVGIARRVAVVPQIVGVAFGFAVRDVVMMGRAPHEGAWMHPRAEDRRAVDEAIETCELGELAARPVGELSGGEQQRVAIARVLAQNAPIVLLDEPAAHLDVRHTVRMNDLLRRQVEDRGLAVLAVLHDLNVTAAFADRVIAVESGKIVAHGKPEDVMTGGRLTKLFGSELEVIDAGGRRVFLPNRKR